MRFTRERLWLVSNSVINQVSSGFLVQLEFVSLCSHRWSFARASAAPADVRSPRAVDPLASPVVATSGSLLLSKSILRAVAHFCCSLKDRGGTSLGHEFPDSNNLGLGLMGLTETTTSVPSVRSCAAQKALCRSNHTTQKNHLGIRTDVGSRCLPCRSSHSNLRPSISVSRQLHSNS